MKARNVVSTAGLTLATVVLAATTVHAVTITEFDGASDEKKGAFLVGTTKQLYNHYKDKDPQKAACMQKLVSAVDENGITDLVHLVVDGIDSARGQNPDELHVQDVMFDVVESACKDFTP